MSDAVRRIFWGMLPLALGLACGNPPAGTDKPDEPAGGDTEAKDVAEPVTPPFPVHDELEGLLLVWFDAEGLHSATRRSDIPAERRAEVRVDSLGVAPEERLDPDFVYVADLRTPGADGSYPVTKRRRDWFEARLGALAPPPEAKAAALADEGVTLYRTSWCGVCRTAASFFHERNVTFVEKDIEKDPGARAEMLEKARAAGKAPTGVPVIDFHGNILLGFQEEALDRLVRAHAARP